MFAFDGEQGGGLGDFGGGGEVDGDGNGCGGGIGFAEVGDVVDGLTGVEGTMGACQVACGAGDSLARFGFGGVGEESRG